MKNLVALFLLAGTFVNHSQASECIRYNNRDFCEGDKVFYPSAKNPGQYFGRISKIEQPVFKASTNIWGNRVVEFDDGSTQNDNNGYHGISNKFVGS